MSNLLKFLLLLATITIVSCDPGMTIRQTELPGRAKYLNLEIHIDTTRHLIGETWYARDVTATNLSNAPITVVKIELVTDKKTFTNKPVGKAKLPVTISPGQTATLPIWIDMNASVGQTFKNAVELRVFYKLGNERLTSSAFLIAESLDGSDRP